MRRIWMGVRAGRRWISAAAHAERLLTDLPDDMPLGGHIVVDLLRRRLQTIVELDRVERRRWGNLAGWLEWIRRRTAPNGGSAR